MQLTLDEVEGMLYVADREYGVAVFTVEGEFVRRITPVETSADRRDWSPLSVHGVTIACGMLVVCGNRKRKKVAEEAEEDGEESGEDVDWGEAPEDNMGEVQVLCLEGSLRQSIRRPGSLTLGGCCVDYTDENAPNADGEGFAKLFVTERGPWCGADQGSLIMYFMIYTDRRWDLSRLPPRDGVEAAEQDQEEEDAAGEEGGAPEEST